MFYVEDDYTMRHSKFSKIKTSNPRSFILLGLSLVTAVITGLVFFNPSVFINFFVNLYWYENSLYYNSFLYLFLKISPIIFFVSFFPIIWVIYDRVIIKIKLNKVSAAGTEIEIDSKSTHSVISKYMDEIVHFFQVTEYNIIIFEDFDRFENLTEVLFPKLRELNNILNKSKELIENSDKIVFVYAVRDNLFYDENRTKFFDYIIPVIPFMDVNNSIDRMIKKFTLKPKDSESSEDKDINEKLIVDEDLIHLTAIYIKDYRILTNIIHEFNYYREKLDKKVARNLSKLLALIVIKNIKPTVFNDLQQGKGKIVEVIKNGKKSSSSEKIHQSIKELEKKISEIKNEHLQNEKEIMIIYAYKVVEYSGRLNNPISSTIQKMINNKTNFEDSILTGRSPGYRRNAEKIQKLGGSYKKRIENLEIRKNEEIEDLQKKIERKRNKISRLHNMTIYQKLNSEDSDFEINKNDIDSPLIKRLLESGHIDENYKYYISLFIPGRLDKNDFEFYNAVQDNVKLDFDYNISNTESIINMLSYKEFSNVYALNIHIVEFLLLNYNNREKYLDSLNEMFKIIRGDEIGFDFSIEYINKKDNIGIYLEKLLKSNIDWWMTKVIKKIPEDSNSILLTKNILSYVKIESIRILNKDQLLRSIAQNVEFLQNIDISFEDELLNKYKTFDVKFRGFSIENLKDNVIEYIVSHNLYEFEHEIFMSLYNYYIKDHEKNELNSIISKLKDNNQNMYFYLKENLVDFFTNFYLSTDQKFDEEYIIFIDLLNNKDLTIDLKERYLLKSKNKVKDLIEIPDVNVINIVLKIKKFKISWHNLEYLINEYMSASENLEEDRKNVESILSQNIEILKHSFNEYNEGVVKFLLNSDIKPIVLEEYFKEIYYKFNDKIFLDNKESLINLSKSNMKILVKMEFFDYSKEFQELILNHFLDIEILFLQVYYIEIKDDNLDYYFDNIDKINYEEILSSESVSENLRLNFISFLIKYAKYTDTKNILNLVIKHLLNESYFSKILDIYSKKYSVSSIYTDLKKLESKVDLKTIINIYALLLKINKKVHDELITNEIKSKFDNYLRINISKLDAFSKLNTQRHFYVKETEMNILISNYLDRMDIISSITPRNKNRKKGFIRINCYRN
jgi:hypothetical protein